MAKETTTRRPAYDAVIVGARCAGAATAMLLSRLGLRVLAVDRGRYGTDTLSTHALMRGGVLQLRRWGVLDRIQAAGTPAVRTTTFHYGDEALAIAIKPRDGVDALYAPRRTVLDAALVDAARDAGAEVEYGVRLAGLLRSSAGRVSGIVLEGPDGNARPVEAGLVVGADGLRSTVARLAGAATYRVGRHAGGVVYGYWSGLDVDGFHWYFRPGVSAGALPTNGGEACVFVAVPGQRFRDEIRFDVASGFHRVLAESAPEFARTLGSGRQSGNFRGFAGEAGFFRQSYGPGWALVGDAGYFRDPITAHGITDALRDAELLARAVARGTDEALAGYQAGRDALALGLFEASDDIASFAWDLPAVQRTHRAMSDEMNREVAALAALDDPGPAASPARGADGYRAASAWRSQARARSQSRWAVRSDTPSASAVSCSE